MLEFEDDQGFIESNQGSTTVTIDDPIKSRKQRKATGTAPEEKEIDPLDSDDHTEVSGTQSWKSDIFISPNEVLSQNICSFVKQLLSGEKKSAPFWTFEFYQRLFDVDSHQVSQLNLYCRIHRSHYSDSSNS